MYLADNDSKWSRSNDMEWTQMIVGWTLVKVINFQVVTIYARDGNGEPLATIKVVFSLSDKKSFLRMLSWFLGPKIDSEH